MNHHVTHFEPLAAPRGTAHDFDFLHGDWTVVSKRLKQRWVGSDDWDVYEGKTRCEPRIGGHANIEEVAFPTRGFSGLTLRLYDPQLRRWAIYWINSTGGVLFPPVHGGFVGDHGVFVGRDEDAGVPINVQFFWTRLSPNAARWSQAFSQDGIVWETNWIMELHR